MRGDLTPDPGRTVVADQHDHIAELQAELARRLERLPREELIDADVAIERAKKALSERFTPSPR